MLVSTPSSVVVNMGAIKEYEEVVDPLSNLDRMPVDSGARSVIHKSITP